jgi:hypothetical protein
LFVLLGTNKSTAIAMLTPIQSEMSAHGEVNESKKPINTAAMNLARQLHVRMYPALGTGG